jgi:hypothetical protein
LWLESKIKTKNKESIMLNDDLLVCSCCPNQKTT